MRILIRRTLAKGRGAPPAVTEEAPAPPAGPRSLHVEAALVDGKIRQAGRSLETLYHQAVDRANRASSPLERAEWRRTAYRLAEVGGAVRYGAVTGDDSSDLDPVAPLAKGAALAHRPGLHLDPVKHRWTRDDPDRPKDWSTVHPNLSRQPPPGVDVERGGPEDNWLLRWRHPETGETVQAYDRDYLKQNAAAKFQRMASFGQALHWLRQRTHEHATAHDLSAPAVLGAMTKILDAAMIRAGNEDSAKAGVFGLTTLRKDHARVDGDRVTFEYVGKAGVPQRQTVEDPDVARTVRDLLKLPGDRLFQFRDPRGNLQAINARRLNGYVQQHTGGAGHVKDFRTYHATRLFHEASKRLGLPADESDAEQKIRRAAMDVAVALGHKRLVTRPHFVRVNDPKRRDITRLSELHGGRHMGGGVVSFLSAKERDAFHQAVGGKSAATVLRKGDRPAPAEPEWVHEEATSLADYIDPTVVEAYRRSRARTQAAHRGRPGLPATTGGDPARGPDGRRGGVA